MDRRTLDRALDGLPSGPGPAAVYSSCGRVNLIGEHVDYHGGPVLPVAIDAGVVVAARRLNAQRLSLGSADFELRFEGHLAELPPGSPGWCAYPLGVLRQLRAQGAELPGLALSCAGSVPQGAGLSSSAALLVATAVALRELAGLDPVGSPDLEACALLAHQAETREVGVPCGIMDHWATAFAEHGQALHLDCRLRQHRAVPLPADRLGLVLLDSGTRHELTDGGYRQRVDEGARALEGLRRYQPELPDLASASVELLAAAGPELDPTAFRRARHVITEVARVGRAVDSLKEGQLMEFGRQLDQSHISLRDDYAVSTERLDALFQAATECEEFYGSRLTGAGFGGCLLAAARRGREEEGMAKVQEAFARRFGQRPAAWTLGYGRAPGRIE